MRRWRAGSVYSFVHDYRKPGQITHGDPDPAPSSSRVPGRQAALQRAASSSGGPLPTALRGELEQTVGSSLADVRVHADGTAADAAHAVNAHAFAFGQDIYFGAGEYDPSSPRGRSLIAHEVAHTVQQRGASGALGDSLDTTTPGDALEGEADRVADAFGRGARSPVASGGTTTIARKVIARQERDGQQSTEHLRREVDELRQRQQITDAFSNADRVVGMAFDLLLEKLLEATGVFRAELAKFRQVLEARARRQALMRDFIGTVLSAGFAGFFAGMLQHALRERLRAPRLPPLFDTSRPVPAPVRARGETQVNGQATAGSDALKNLITFLRPASATTLPATANQDPDAWRDEAHRALLRYKTSAMMSLGEVRASSQQRTEPMTEAVALVQSFIADANAALADCKTDPAFYAERLWEPFLVEWAQEQGLLGRNRQVLPKDVDGVRVIRVTNGPTLAAIEQAYPAGRQQIEQWFTEARAAHTQRLFGQPQR